MEKRRAAVPTAAANSGVNEAYLKARALTTAAIQVGPQLYQVWSQIFHQPQPHSSTGNHLHGNGGFTIPKYTHTWHISVEYYCSNAMQREKGYYHKRPTPHSHFSIFYLIFSFSF